MDRGQGTPAKNRMDSFQIASAIIPVKALIDDHVVTARAWLSTYNISGIPRREERKSEQLACWLRSRACHVSDL